MRLRLTPLTSARSLRLERIIVALPVIAIAAQLLLAAPIAQAGAVYPNPPNATPIAWPSSFTTYTTDTGTPIADVEGEAGVGSVYDISSAAGSSTSVFLALSGGSAFFRARVGADPVDVSKGGYTNATWLVLIATQDTPGVWTTKAVSGVDGKPVGSAAAPDRVYVGNAPGTGITDVYQFTKDAPAFDPLNAVGTGSRVVSAGGGQYFIDWQIPVSTLVSASGGAVTASTPVRLFFGSSAAANLATINKDFMTGGAVSFANLATVTLSPPTLTLTQSKALVSGANPPQAGSPSVYDVTVTARNTGGSNLFIPSVSVTIPAGVSIVSQSTATGSIGAVGQTVTWTPGTMAGGAATISATIRVSVTPGVSDVGSILTIANAAAGTGSDGVVTITGTGTAQVAGPVADSPHATSTSVSCPGASLVYGATTTCTITVTDTRATGATVPTGTVTLTGTLGSSTACSLSAATATSSSCTVTFTATGVGTGSLSGAYAGDATHAASSGASGGIPIVKKDLTVSTVAASRVYGAANPGFAVTWAGFVLGDTPSALGGTLGFSTAATAASPVGTYAVTPSGLTSANYAFAYIPANLSVTPAPLTITANDASRNYGDANPTLTAAYAGFVNGDDAADLDTPTVLSTTATAASATGTYSISASGATSTNYSIAFVSGTLTVGTTALTITADDASRVYGDPNPAFTVTISGFRNGDTLADLGGSLSCSTTAVPTSNVGTYPITCSGLTSGDYAITFAAGTLSVSAAVLDVVPAPQTRPYGAANPALTVGFTGFRNGDTTSVISGSAACSTSAGATSAPGTYPISCTAGTLAAANYTFDASATANLTVTAASLTIAVDPASKVYGTVNPPFSVTPTGLQNGETLAALAGTLVFTTAAGPGSDVGSYPVAPSGLSSPNYAITFTAGTLTVTKATLTVSPIDAAILPGDPIPATFVTNLSGFVAGDDTGVVSGAASCSTDAVAGDPPGTYTITCAIGTLAAANYDFVIGGTAVFTIGTVTLQIIVADATKSYGDPNPAFSVSYAGFVNGDTEAVLGGTLAFTTAAIGGSPAGTYPVTASGLTSATYVLNFQAGTLTIEPAAQSIAFGPLGGATYGDAAFDLSATSTSGLAVTFTATGACSVSGITVTITGAGACTITAHQAGDANHAAAPDVARTFAIAKSTPVLTWATPAAITAGTALSGTQLNATASVAGSFVYSPVAGTVLAVGPHVLQVTFSPTDSANYESVVGTVTITVAAASQTLAFGPLPDVAFGHGPITLAATASSGLPVSYTVTGPCSVSGSILTISGLGTCAVTAHQAGDASYDPAAPVTVSFDVLAVSMPTPSSIDTDRDFASQGGHVVVTATGFRPGSSVTVTLGPDGEPVTVVADADGTVIVTLPVARDAAAGPHTIAAIGVDPNGAALALTTDITVLALPATSTLDSPPIDWSMALIAAGLALLVLAAALSRNPDRHRRQPHGHRVSSAR